MNWKKLFMPGKDLTVTEAQEFMAKRGGDSYQLLDVRQPSEYEAGHLAGAILIPLKELPDRLAELDEEKPLIVYCAIGGRGKVAAQLLRGHGFENVFNMAGGIKAWQGSQATGPEQAGLELITGEGDYADGICLAYAMEDGLQQFYRLMADQASSEADHKLFTRLMGFEDRHKTRLLAECRTINGESSLPDQGTGDVMESGERVRDLLARMAGRLRGTRDILEFAMALETQAFDLYSRLARKAEHQEVQALFVCLASEEKTHLIWLADQLDIM